MQHEPVSEFIALYCAECMLVSLNDVLALVYLHQQCEVKVPPYQFLTEPAQPSLLVVDITCKGSMDEGSMDEGFMDDCTCTQGVYVLHPNALLE